MRIKPRRAGIHGPLSPASVLLPFRIIFGNAQSWLAGIIGGLLFVPTTIGALVWATAFLRGGEHMSMADAASDAAMVPVGWVIGCPLLGYVSDRIGRRKPVVIGGAIVMLAAGVAAIYVPVRSFPRYSVAIVLGVASGAAMIPFSMMKEANPSEVKGTAAGVMNFLVFLTIRVVARCELLQRRANLSFRKPVAARAKLTIDHIKPRLLGHWGTSPSLNLIYVHINRLIKKYDLNTIDMVGPGHGGPAALK